MGFLKFKVKQKIKFKNKHRGFDSYEFRLGDLLRGERATLGKSLMDIQRELKINVNIVSAIENCDISGHEDSVFISGYVRSYAKFLNLDQQWVFDLFCKESGYSMPSSLSTERKKTNNTAIKTFNQKISLNNSFEKKSNVFLEKPSGFNKLKLRSFFSFFALIFLIFGIGLGGWFVMKEIQQVKIVGEDIFPIIIDDGINKQDKFTQVLVDKLANNSGQIFFKSLDGPIADIDINKSGFFEKSKPVTKLGVVSLKVKNIESSNNQNKTISILASRPAWVRIYTKDGKVINEDILNTGQIMKVPSNMDNVILRSGNAGSVFIKIDNLIYGPIGDGTSVVKNISLKLDDIIENFLEVTDEQLLNPLKRINLLSKNND